VLLHACTLGETKKATTEVKKVKKNRTGTNSSHQRKSITSG